jgi:hypothetical protein
MLCGIEFGATGLLSSHKIVRLLRVVSAIPTATPLAMTALQHRTCHCEPILRHCERSEAISKSQNLIDLGGRGRLIVRHETQ